MVQLVKLPVARALSLRPHKSSFKQTAKHMTRLRERLSQMTCISKDSTFSVLIGDETFKLNVDGVVPQSHTMLGDAAWSIDLNLLDALDDCDEEDADHAEADEDNSR